MKFCTCKIRKLSQTRLDSKDNIWYHVQYNKIIKCEYKECNNPANNLYVSYFVCDEHLKDANQAYANVREI